MFERILSALFIDLTMQIPLIIEIIEPGVSSKMASHQRMTDLALGFDAQNGF